MFWVQVSAAHMGGILGQVFSNKGSFLGGFYLDMVRF